MNTFTAQPDDPGANHEDSALVGGCLVFCPTRRQRFWRALGFKTHFTDAPDDHKPYCGWCVAQSHVSFSLLDRLRLLLTGRLTVRHVVETQHSFGEHKASFEMRIYAPGEVFGE